MPSFDIADCPTSLTLVAPPGDTTGKTSATLALTIRNVTDRRRTGRVMIEPSATAKPDWFALDGSPTSPLEEQIDFEPRATRTVQATVTVPPGTPGGAHTLRVRVTAEQDPDNDFVQSGTVALTVPAPPPVVQPPPKAFPWWIIAAGAATVVVIAAILYFALRHPSPPQPQPQAPTLVGNWVNTDPHTRDIPRIAVAERTLHVWGACSPQDCDWGETPLQPVAGNAGKATAHYDQGFAERSITLTLGADGRLVMSTLNHYKDNSGRQDRTDTNTFTRR